MLKDIDVLYWKCIQAEEAMKGVNFLYKKKKRHQTLITDGRHLKIMSMVRIYLKRGDVTIESLKSFLYRSASKRKDSGS